MRKFLGYSIIIFLCLLFTSFMVWASGWFFLVVAGFIIIIIGLIRLAIYLIDGI